MHEWKTAQSVAAKVRELGSDVSRVTTIRVRLGPQSHIDEQTLKSHLRLLTEGSDASSAEVVIVGPITEDGDNDVVLESIDVEI